MFMMVVAMLLGESFLLSSTPSSLLYCTTLYTISLSLSILIFFFMGLGILLLLTEVKAVADMHQRKAEMAKHSDAFITLPVHLGLEISLMVAGAMVVVSPARLKVAEGTRLRLNSFHRGFAIWRLQQFPILLMIVMIEK